MASCVVHDVAGHKPTLAMLSSLSRRQHPSQGHLTAGLAIHYGSHMAVSMAIGLLFLGSGSLSLSTSNEAVAALLIAAYPALPVSPLDNRFHLQVRV